MQYVQVELDPATVELAQCEPFDETPRESFSISIICWLESLKSHIPWTMVYNQTRLSASKIDQNQEFQLIRVFDFIYIPK